MTTATQAQLEHLPIAGLVPYARNSRTHSPEQVGQLAASIREFGFTNPILIDEAGGIIAGHGRVMAAQSIGLDRVPCLRLTHLTEAQKRAYVIADNKLALNAGWDQDLLAAEIRALQLLEFDVGLTGFGDKELGELFAALDLPPEGGTGGQDPEAAPPVPATPVSRLGDIWLLGRHRVICGDSTDLATYARLMGGGMADVVWTDPPYNVAYETDAGKIANDSLSDGEFRQFLTAAFAGIVSAMKPGAAIYVAHADAGETGISFRTAFLAAGLKLAQCLIWQKDSLVLGRSDYQWIHEPILYGWRPGAAHRFYGGRKQTTVTDLGASGSPFVRRADGRWQITIGEEVLIVDGAASVEYVEDSIIRELRPKRNDVHPTMKPVALIQRMLRNSAKPGAIVLDAFGGSGSTLIAAEPLGMSARLVEIDPGYTDVIVRRWEQFTGQHASHEAGGTFTAVAQQRQREAA